MARAWSSMLEIVRPSPANAGKPIIEKFGRRPMVRSLLLLYGLHPVELRDAGAAGAGEDATLSCDLTAETSNWLFLDDAGVVTCA